MQPSVLELGDARGVFEGMEYASTTLVKVHLLRADLNTIQEGYDTIYCPSSKWLCFGYIRASKMKVCTCATCSAAAHHMSRMTSF
eukprot:15337041-Ditylum_brightwellii.AAC.1